MTPEYLADRHGRRLLEVVARERVRNYGLRGGTITYVVARDCVTELARRVGPLELALLDPVPVDRKAAA